MASQSWHYIRAKNTRKGWPQKEKGKRGVREKQIKQVNWRPKVTLTAHWVQSGPMMLGLQLHTPTDLSQLSDPQRLHVHAEKQQRAPSVNTQSYNAHSYFLTFIAFEHHEKERTGPALSNTCSFFLSTASHQYSLCTPCSYHHLFLTCVCVWWGGGGV